MRVLAIETSCDETAAAVVEGDRTSGVRVLSNVIASQVDLHARTKGVVPEVAARAHVEAITFVIDDAIKQADIEPRSLDAIVVTTKPGLRPALVIGETAARTLAVAWDKPLIPVHHIAGHIAAGWLDAGMRNAESGMLNTARHTFPIVILVVSGGHTQLYRMDESFSLRLLGQTRDDAAGEAFDKIARLLGLPYPGGPALAKLAEKGDACEIELPRPMIDSGDDDFSFSGLKTAVLYKIRQLTGTTPSGSPLERGRTLDDVLRADIAASTQEAIVDVLVAKTINAAAREGAKIVLLTGGVAANARLRERLHTALGSLPLIVPNPQYCTDNAAMIGTAAVLNVQIPSQEIV